MKKIVLLLCGFGLVSMLGGCVHRASSYAPSHKSINALHQLAHKGKAINLRPFIDPEKKSYVTCRMEGSEALPGGITYAEYLHNAVKADLNSVGLYSANSKVKLDATLDKIDQNSMAGGLGNGEWTIQMTFNDHKQKPYTINSIYKFSTNLIADIACTEVAQAFVPAVQKFVNTLYGDKHFKKTLGAI